MKDPWKLFLKGQYWEAHEEWEEHWRRASGNQRYILQSLIQTCALGLKLRTEHRLAAERLRRRILELSMLANVDEWSANGLSQRDFCELIRRWSGSPEEFLPLLNSEIHKES